MPSFLGCLFGISFRTERLIMNIIGLVNSTLDWHPLKWTNKLEQIWSLSLSQRTLILETIGEERIKAVLSYIVIARILIAHVFTLSYITNFYPIITWNRPNLLLPWLILSFFKNVVLEVIVIAVGLLFWYDKRFSLPIFLEFVLVKFVPLVFATYNWYSNSCLYLELRRNEKIRKLRRGMRSDSNLIASRPYLKIAESKYRTRSVTTLISWESYDTNDSNDTISHIMEDPNLLPEQKAMRILGLNELDVENARARIREREMHKRLTEAEDEEFLRSPGDIRRYFSMVSQYDLGMRTLLSPRNEAGRNSLNEDIDKDGDGSNDQLTRNETVESGSANNEAGRSNSGLSKPPSSPTKHLATGTSESHINDPLTMKTNDATLETPEDLKPSPPITETIDDPNRSPRHPTPETHNPTQGPNQSADLADLADLAGRSSPMKEDGINIPEDNNIRHVKLCQSCHVIDINHSSSFSKKENTTKLHFQKSTKVTVDGSCSPMPLQSLFNCNCVVDEHLFKENMQECCLSNSAAMRTSTPNGSPNREKELASMVNDGEYPKDHLHRSLANDCIKVNETGESGTNSGSALPEELLWNDLDMLKSTGEDDQGSGNNFTAEHKPGQEALTLSVNETEDLPKMCRTQSNASTDVQSPSRIVKNLSVTKDVADNLETLPLAKPEESASKVEADSEVRTTTVSSPNCPVDNSSLQWSTSNLYKEDMDKESLNINLPQYSFGDTNIPRFYKDSMKVFDGCYEKDFANNSELQCLLRQLEKKKWSLFPGQTGHELLLPSSFFMQNDEYLIQNLRAAYHLTSDYENMDRYEIGVSSSSKTNNDQVISQIVQLNEQSRDEATHTPNDSHKLSILKTPKKDACTQTIGNDQSKSPTHNLTDGKKRRRSALKCKRLKEEGRSVSPIGSIHNRKTESQGSICPNGCRVSLRQKPTRTTDDGQRKPPRIAKSLSDRSVCECKMPQVDSKHSSEWRLDKKDERRRSALKSKVEAKLSSFGTVPLPQVAKPSMFDTVVYRRKPPVYPKKTKNEIPTQRSSSSASSKKMSAIKKLLEDSKKPVDRQSAHSSRKFKWKGKMEEQEAREMRALKAYNEITLMEDKKELEARKRTSLNGSSTDGITDVSKSRRRTTKSPPNMDPPQNVNQVDVDYLDKENLYVDATTETEPLISIPPRDMKLFTGGKFGSISNEKYPCAKLSKVNKVTDKLLDNFDRLHGGLMKQDVWKSRQTVETDTRKQYTKYSKPKKLTEEENVSVASIKKLEGAQRGRELERTQAKEDVRNRLGVSVMCSTEGRLAALEPPVVRSCSVEPVVEESYGGSPSTSADDRMDERRDDGGFKTIKTTVMKDVVSSWSSSTVDQGDEAQLPMEDDVNVASQVPTGPKLQSEIVEREIDVPVMPVNVFPVPSTKAMILEGQGEVQSCIEDHEDHECHEYHKDYKDHEDHKDHMDHKDHEDLEDHTDHEDPEDPSLQSPQSSHEFVPVAQTTNLRDFARNIEVTRTQNSVILTNPSAARGEKIQHRNIVDDDTIRMLHHAFSDRSMDLILDLSGEILTVNDMLNSGQLRIEDDEFNFQPSRETMGVPMEELPPLPHEEHNFKRQILATICRLQSSEEEGQEDGPCRSTGLPISSEIGSDNEFDEDEEIEPVEINDLEINDILSTVIQFLRSLNVRDFSFDGVSGVRYEIVQDVFEDEDDEPQHVEGDDEGEEEIEEHLMMFERLLRFVREDICTNIRFPIIVGWSDVVAASLDTRNEVPEEFDIELLQIEPSKVNFFCLEDREDEVVVTSGFPDGKCYEDVRSSEPVKNLRRVEHPTFEAAFFSGQLTSIDDRETFGNILNVDRLATSLEAGSTDSRNTGEYLKNMKRCTMIFPDTTQEFKNSSSGEAFNRTYKLLRDISEENEVNDEEAYGGDVEENIGLESLEENSMCRVLGESIKVIECANSVNMDKIEEMVEENRFTELDDEETNGTELPESRKILDNQEDDSFESLVGIQEHLSLYLKTEDENEEEEVEEEESEEKHKEDKAIQMDKEMTFKIILTFWLIVLYFYIRYFYEKIFSLKQVSRSTSTLKPFEIHTMPTSTTTLLENTDLIEKIQNHDVLENKEYEEEEDDEDEEEEEKSHFLHEIIDLEPEETFHENHPLSSFDANAFRILSDDFNTRKKGPARTIENEVEKTMMYLSERVTENVKILPFFTSEESISTDNEEETIDPKESPFNSNLPSQSQSPSNPLPCNSQVNPDSVRELIQTDPNDRPSILELDPRKRLELRLAEEEIKALGYEDHDDSTSQGSLDRTDQDETKSPSKMELRKPKVFPYAEIEIEEVTMTELQEAPDVTSGVHDGVHSGENKGDPLLSFAVDAREERYQLSNEDEEQMFQEGQNTERPEGNVFSKRNAKEDGGSTVQNALTSSPESLNANMLSTDSFDSTYTGISEASRNSISVTDLNVSSMEDFAINSNGSNASNDSD